MTTIQTPLACAVQRRLSQIATSSSREFANGEETEEEAANVTVPPPAGDEDPAPCGDLWRLRGAVGDVRGDRQRARRRRRRRVADKQRSRGLTEDEVVDERPV